MRSQLYLKLIVQVESDKRRGNNSKARVDVSKWITDADFRTTKLIHSLKLSQRSMEQIKKCVCIYEE